ncbi:MAG: hypothetical protein ABIS38_03525 [Sphingomicrobium sp.]
MKRAFHVGLLMMALLGLIGQSTAIAMPPPAVGQGELNMPMPGADCVEMTGVPSSKKHPCTNMTFQCMLAMGCMPLSLIESDGIGRRLVAATRDKIVPSPVARLHGRSYGPELDPPSFLI